MKILNVFFILNNILLVNSLEIKKNYNNLENKVLFDVPYKNLVKNIEDNSIKKIYFSKNLDKIISENNDIYSSTTITPLVTNNLVDLSVKNNVDTIFYEMPIQNSIEKIYSDTFSFIISNPFIILFISYLFIRSFTLNNLNNGTFQPPFINNNVKINGNKEMLKNLNISLSSFAGSQEIFEECTEVVSYLKNSTIYKNAGAEIPKGILLEGPPGTGKTLLAKAIASEAEANFISISASEFIEVFVGVGALKIRNLFKNARNNLPCIIFIDEIDSVGRQRGAGFNMGNDEREQTLNQLLAEMDGFVNNNGILVIAATNRKDVLDSALLRPGRFDRIITVPLPDRNSRKDIICVHSKNKNLDPLINLDYISELTSGFSGAQIKNLLNEAAIYAARDSRIVINENDIINALDKLIVGLVRKNDNRSNDAIKRVAIHEIGHALLCKKFDKYFDLKKVSIQSTYNGAGGYTLFNEYQNIVDSGLYTKDLLKKRLIIALGGKAAEYLYYSSEYVSIGAVQDLKQANSLAQTMIGNYGMGEDLEVFYNENIDYNRNPFLGKTIGNGIKYSEKTKEIFDRESLKLVIESFEEAKKILFENKEKMDILIDKLLEKKILYNIDFQN